jgi:hypothetical protein
MIQNEDDIPISTGVKGKAKEECRPGGDIYRFEGEAIGRSLSRICAKAEWEVLWRQSGWG